MNKQNRNSLIHSENRLKVVRGEGVWGDWVKQVKGLSSVDRQLQNSHGDVKYSTGNIVNDIAITMCGYQVATGNIRGNTL